VEAEVDVARVGSGRMKRIVPVGFRWAYRTKPIADGLLHCTPTSGFLQGHMQGVYEDGCTYEFTAPQFAVIEAGHDGWVVGDEPAVFLQYDFEEGTARRFGVPERHGHG
jgi:hypothetical protein